MSSSGAALTVTMIRCSTLLLEWRGQRWLTDPWFAMHIRGIPCLRRPGLRSEDLPPLDAVWVSHLHPDHYDPKAMARCRGVPHRWVFPPGSAAALGGLPAGGEELAPWSSTRLGEVELTAVPGPHTLPKPDEINFVARLPGWGSLFFGGDAKLDRAVMRRIRTEHGPMRLAMLPVGATRIFGKRTVMCPPHAAEAADILEAERVIPIHEGGIWLSVPPASLHRGRAVHLQEIMRRRGQGQRVLLLREGERASL
jgi:L-ascorbate metabolism protein UlaG (beta-lactamase superfamily)